ncbi:hypothetical protein C7M84_006458 [Penaeus vannamei]|uniref:Uncharacterized protein n=1 Tax=Penaeus vannamei TaxID=6689 RepID=A0A3R7MTV2_PENVA|nr:hypothetical protein C7M84_006458 [Penaeus vannamei]
MPSESDTTPNSLHFEPTLIAITHKLYSFKKHLHVVLMQGTWHPHLLAKSHMYTMPGMASSPTFIHPCLISFFGALLGDISPTPNRNGPPLLNYIRLQHLTHWNTGGATHVRGGTVDHIITYGLVASQVSCSSIPSLFSDHIALGLQYSLPTQTSLPHQRARISIPPKYCPTYVSYITSLPPTFDLLSLENFYNSLVPQSESHLPFLQDNEFTPIVKDLLDLLDVYSNALSLSSGLQTMLQDIAWPRCTQTPTSTRGMQPYESAPPAVVPELPPWRVLHPAVTYTPTSKSDPPLLQKQLALETIASVSTLVPAAHHLYVDGSLQADGSAACAVGVIKPNWILSLYLVMNQAQVMSATVVRRMMIPAQVRLLKNLTGDVYSARLGGPEAGVGQSQVRCGSRLMANQEPLQHSTSSFAVAKRTLAIFMGWCRCAGVRVFSHRSSPLWCTHFTGPLSCGVQREIIQLARHYCHSLGVILQS